MKHKGTTNVIFPFKGRPCVLFSCILNYWLRFNLIVSYLIMYFNFSQMFFCRQLQMSGVKSSHSATVLPTSNQAPAVKRSSSFTEIRVGPPTQVQIDDDEVDDVDGILDDVVSEKRLRENVDKLDVSKYADRVSGLPNHIWVGWPWSWLFNVVAN